MSLKMAIDLETLTLTVGLHRKRSDGVCVMEAVAWLAGTDHSDRPVCTSPVLGTFMRQWNDDLPSDADRNRLLKPLLPLLIGTNTGAVDDAARSWMVTDWLVRVYVPVWLDLAELTDEAQRMRDLPTVTAASLVAAMSVLTRAAARAVAWDAARAVAWDAAGVAAGVAALDAASAATRAAARAAVRDAARAVAWAAAWAAAGGLSWAAAGNAASAAARAAARDAAGVAAGNAASAAARAAVRDAAGAAVWAELASIVSDLQLSAQDLVRRMCAVGKKAV